MANENNFNYVKLDELKTLYGFVPDDDQITTDATKTNYTIMAIAIASERINTISGNQIESIGFANLNDSQKALIKRATGRMTIYYLTDGMSFLRSSVSMSGNGLSSSISPPSEPDYVLNEVYNLLQQAGLHTPRKGITENKYCSGYANFNTVSPYDESDLRVITWDSANKTFMRSENFISSDNSITITELHGTAPKLDLKAVFNLTTQDLIHYFDQTWFGIYNNEIVINNDAQERIADVIGNVYPYQNLETHAKTLVFAINENLSGIKQLLIQVQLVEKDINSKQNIVDNTLQTESKTVTGAINEIFNKPILISDDDPLLSIEKDSSGVNRLGTETKLKKFYAFISSELLNKQDKDDDRLIAETKNLVDFMNSIFTDLTNNPFLKTTAKDYTGAINELNSKLDKLLQAIKSL